MKIKELKLKLWSLSKKVAEDLGYEIVDIEYKQGSKHDILTIFIYNEKGIDTDDCQKMSQHLEIQLDESQFIDVPYYLEVSSPGLDRPIKTTDDYRRNLNKEVTVKLYAPLNGQKVVEGILSDYNSEAVTISVNDIPQSIPIKSISSMKQTIKF